jgi:hypothetical protein
MAQLTAIVSAGHMHEPFSWPQFVLYGSASAGSALGLSCCYWKLPNSSLMRRGFASAAGVPVAFRLHRRGRFWQELLLMEFSSFWSGGNSQLRDAARGTYHAVLCWSV